MTDSIDINMVFPPPTEQPSLNRLDRLGEETDQYRTSVSVVDTINFGGETDSGYRYSTGLDTYDADVDWYTLPSMPAVKMVLLASDLEDSPDLEDTVQDVLDRIAFIYQSVDGCQYVYGLDVEHQTKLDRDSGSMIPVSQESLADNRIEAVSWLMVFSPELVEEYGHEWLLSAPTWERRELDDGAIMLVTSHDPTDWNKASTARQDLANYFDLSRQSVKGVMYELRVAEGKLARQLDSGETLKLSYEPDVDFDSSLDSDDISEIANELNIPEDDVESALEYGTPNSANPEFDGWVIESDDTAVYYEAKSGEISRRDIEPKLVRFRGIQRARSDIGQSEFRLNSLGPKSNSNVNGTSWDELNDRDSTDATQFDW